MLTLDLFFFLVAGPAVLFAGISKAGFGSGAAFASASILALVVEPGLALGVMLPLLMLIDVSSLKPYWRKWSTPDVRLLIIGGLLVGFGTRLGSGCTSGHGICGVSRLSLRSIAAVMTFMLTGFATVYLLKHVWGA